jgi:phage host-nuclease inhibitor protein Gam
VLRDIFDLSQSIRFVSKAEDDCQVRRCIAELQDQARNYRRMNAKSDDPNSAWAKFYQDEVEQIAHEIASLEEPLIATPTSRNGTPRTPRTP